jgi:hypothetical protein
LRKFYRQGDIAFEEIDEIPKGLIVKDSMLEIHGEKEGHVHRMTGIQVLVPPKQKEILPAVIVVEKETEMTHPEHEPLKIPRGIYKVTQFREYQNPRPVD